MRKTYRPSWLIGVIGIVFVGAAVAMFATQVMAGTDPDAASGDKVAFGVGSLIFFLVGVALLIYVINSKLIVEPEGLVFRNMLGQETSRIPWDLINRVTTATEESTDSDGHRHQSTGYYLQVTGLGLVRISSYSNIDGLIKDVEAHAPRIRDDAFSTHTYNPPSPSILKDDIGN